MSRVSPNISRSGASVIGCPAKYFWYHSTPFAWSGTLRWMWSTTGTMGVCAAAGALKATAASSVHASIRNRRMERLLGGPTLTQASEETEFDGGNGSTLEQR